MKKKRQKPQQNVQYPQQTTTNINTTTINQEQQIPLEDYVHVQSNGEQFPQPQQQTQEQQQQSCEQQCGGNVRSCKKGKIAVKVGAFLFLLFPILFLFNNPYGYPWFIWPNGIILLIFGLMKMKKKRRKT